MMAAVRYLWAMPNTVLGLLLAALGIALGARGHIVNGVLEVHGGLLGRWAACAPAAMRFSAMTLGHVILGTNSQALRLARQHEHVHVRQYERWGPMFLPAYLLSSAWQALRGRRFYRDNWFEREAYRQDSALARAASTQTGGGGADERGAKRP